MPRFLSASWIDEANALLAHGPALDLDEPLVVQQCVSAEDGVVTYHMVFSQPGARLVAGEYDQPDIEFSLGYDTATAIAQGQMSAQVAFQSGALAVSGDMARLVARRGLVAACDDLLAPLRAATTYDRADA